MSAPLRIVTVLPSLVVGGAERMATWLAEAQAQQGHDVHVVCLREAGPLLPTLSATLARRVRVVGKESRYDVSVLPRLKRLLAQLAPDVVHTHLFTGLAWGAVAARAAGVPVVVHTHHEVHDDDQRYLPAVRRGLSPMVSAMVGCSTAALEDLRRRHYDWACASLAIDNGLPLQGRPQATLDGLHLMAVGRLVPIKGHEHLIDALARVRAMGVPARLTILGEGELRPRLLAQVRRLGLEDAVHLPGAVHDVAARLAGADLFVQPSLSEAMPMALLEAAAAGLPLLVTDVGGAPTLLRAGAGGYAVEPSSADALAQAIAAHAALPLNERRALGSASHRVALRDFDLAATAATYEEVYRACLARRR